MGNEQTNLTQNQDYHSEQIKKPVEILEIDDIIQVVFEDGSRKKINEQQKANLSRDIFYNALESKVKSQKK